MIIHKMGGPSEREKAMQLSLFNIESRCNFCIGFCMENDPFSLFLFQFLHDQRGESHKIRSEGDESGQDSSGFSIHRNSPLGKSLAQRHENQVKRKVYPYLVSIPQRGWCP